MPGQDDLTEEAARALADKALAGKDADPAAFLDVRSYYYVRNGERDKRLWQSPTGAALMNWAGWCS